MKTQLKRILSVFLVTVSTLTALLLFSAAGVNLPVVGGAALTAAAVEPTSGRCGANMYWTYSSSGVLTITGSGSMYNWSTYPNGTPWGSLFPIFEVNIDYGVTSIGNYAFSDCRDISSFSIPSSVTSIGNSAFSNCSKLTSITIPSNVTSIGSFAFSECTNLKDITISSSVTSIGERAFDGCDALNRVNYAGQLESWLGIAFAGEMANPCHSGANLYFNNILVTDVEIPASVTSIGAATFCGCKSLTSVTLPAGITTIGNYAFSGCTGLTGITLPSAITTIGSYAFSGCTGLTDIVLPAGMKNTGNGSAFKNCTSLSSVTFPTAPNEISNGTFTNCSALTEIEIPASVTDIGANAFYNCDALTNIEIPAGVIILDEQAFSDCDNLADITIHDGILTVYNAFSGTAYYANPANWSGTLFYVGNYLMASTADAENVVVRPGTKCIANEVFYDNNTLKSITLPDSLMRICQDAFLRCNIKSVFFIGSASDWSGVYVNNSGGGNDNFVNAKRQYCRGTCGESLTYTFTSDGVLTVSGTGSMTNWATSASVPWSTKCVPISEIVLSEGVTSVGSYAFTYSDISSISLPASVVTIGAHAFENSHLTAISFDEGNTLSSVGNYAFSNCTSLETVPLPDSVTTIGEYCFNSCTALESFTIPAGTLTIDFYAFKGCTSLSTVNYNAVSCSYTNIPWFSDLPAFTTLNFGPAVKSIPYHAFYNCKSLTSIVMSASITKVKESAFFGCTSITSISMLGDLSDWIGIDFGDEYANPYYVAGILPLFNGEAVTDLTVPSGVERIGSYAFYNDTRLTSVTIPDSVTSIGAEAFAGCTGIETATIGSGVTKVDGYVFRGCSELTDVYFSITPEQWAAVTSGTGNQLTGVNLHFYHGVCGENLTWELASNVLTITGTGAMYDYVKKENVGWYAEREAISSVSISAGVTNIGDYAFYGCTGLTEVVMPAALTFIGERAFEGCTGISDVVIPEGVTSIDICAFGGCTGITDIVIPETVTLLSSGSFNCANLTTVAYNAINCGSLDDATFRPFSGSALTSVTIGPNVELIPSSIFSNSPNLESVTFAAGSHLEAIGYSAFANCGSLTTVNLPAGVTTISSYAFSYCSGITSIVLPGSLTTIGEYAFNGCSAAAMTLGTNVESIDKYAFKDCARLSSIALKSGTTSVSEGAFYGCAGVTSLTLPDSLTTIGAYAFYGCASVKSLTIGSAVTSIGCNAFEDCVGLESLTYNALNCTYVSSYSGTNAPFMGCSAIKTLTIAAGVEAIPAKMFYDLSGITAITIPNSVKTIGRYAFTGCSSAESITIGTGVESVDSYAFSGCTGVTCVNYNAVNCTTELNLTKSNITTINIGEGVTAIPNGAFSGCVLVKEITIPEGVTTIGNNAFRGCSALEAVSVPLSVTAIRDSAFEYCDNLKTIYYPGAERQWKQITLGRDCLGTGTKTIEYGIYDVTSIVVDTVYFKEDGQTYQLQVTVLPENATNKEVTFESSNTSVATVDENGVVTCLKSGTANIIVRSKDPFYTGYGTHWLSVDCSGTASDWIVSSQPTCTVEGERVCKCIYCGRVLQTETIPVIPHTSPDNWTVDAGCKKDVWHKECTVCGLRLETENHNPTVEHIPASEWTTLLNPSCTHEGSKCLYCTVCNSKISEEKIPMVAHTPSRWIWKNVATCTDSGTQCKRCTICNKELETQTVAAYGHTSSDWATYTKATCTTGGVQRKYCTKCGTTLELQDTPALGHVNNNGDTSCDRCGHNMSQNCSCMCHADGIKGFFYKIALIFWKIFKTNQYCECGYKHY